MLLILAHLQLCICHYPSIACMLPMKGFKTVLLVHLANLAPKSVRDRTRLHPPIMSQNTRGGFRGGRGDSGSFRGGRGDSSSFRGGRGDFRGGSSGSGSFRGGSGSFRGGSGSGSFRGGGRGGGPAPLAAQPGPCQMVTNHFKLSVDKSAPALHKHLVCVTGDAADARIMLELRRALLSEALSMNKINEASVIYDGDKILYSQTPVTFCTNISRGSRQSFCVDVSGQGIVINLSDENQENRGEREQCLDVILKEASRSRCTQQNARNFLHEKQQVDLRQGNRDQSEGKTLWMGHFQSCGTSIEPSGPASTVCLNAAAALSYKAQPLSDFTRTKLQTELLTMKTGSDPKYARAFQRAVKGLKFEVRHMGDHARKMKLVGLSDATARTHKFEFEGRAITVEEYFMERFNIKLKYPNAPLIQKAPAAAGTLLPAELVYLSDQCLNGSVTETLKAMVGEIMTMEPGRRLKYIQDSIDRVYGSNDVLKRYGVHLDQNAMRVQGMVLEPPTLMYSQPGKSSAAVTMRVANGRWNMARMAFNSGCKIDNWGVLVACNAQLQTVKDVMKELTNMANNVLNMKFNPTPRFCTNVRVADMERERDKLIESAKQNRILDILFVLIPSPDTYAYKHIKTLFDPVCTTQVLTQQKTPLLNGKDRGMEGHWANVLSKLNEKCGGINQKLSVANLTVPAVKYFLGDGRDTCIISSAFSNPSPLAECRGTNRAALPTLTSMVCSVDRDCTRYIHTFRGQCGNRETVANFSEMLSYLLKTRCRLTAQQDPPKRLVYLRDGVSDTGFEAVMSDELRAIDLAYKELGRPAPQVLAIAVRRAHQTRFFPTDLSDPRTNMPPGTVVFDNLTLPLPYPNFFLLSHAGIKGTSHPARYVVVKDDLKDTDPKLKAMQGQELLKTYAHFLFQLAHLYGRCQRSVSVPAPVYYATLLAERGRLHISDIAQKYLGLSTVQDDLSSFCGNTTKLDDSELRAFAQQMNAKLMETEAGTRPMFYV